MILFVRHGRTDYNDKYLLCGGDLDISINEVGRDQAIKTAELLKNEKIDKIYCSPLLRAKQTCDEILKYHKGVKVKYDDRLKEMLFGKFNGVICLDLDKIIWKVGSDVSKFEGVESVSHLYERVKSFIDEISAESKNKNILIVAHNGIGRVLKCIFYGYPQSGDLNDYDCKNCEVLKFNVE